MPNNKSTEKRLRQNKKRRQRNKAIKTSLRSNLRKVDIAVTDGDVESTESAFCNVARQLDRVASKKIIHPNKAARLKSRMSSKLKALKAGN
ncbi:MAG TPA: 30S ribosomal protein S20 [Pirellulales bacterium]|nr:30S ribosomal protein S20 [Pirellulales bacterium]|tara:strand:+ start:748 stop:1020 length:273 start_codon:yes stop_codon:yes gene_type:complete